MYDVSGEGWIKHMLYGTSKILQLRGPDAHRSGRGRSFFLTVRVFEICRTIIFSEPTFLQEEAWKSMVKGLWEGSLVEEWHPKEALFDLMLECSELSQKVWVTINQDCQSEGEFVANLRELVVTGLQLRDSLESWNLGFQAWNSRGTSYELDPRSVLARICYHAISIYLSGIFDYRSQFDDISTPFLPLEAIQLHVYGIISQSFGALKSTKLAGVLLFFPLRVAGARAVLPEHKETILDMLREISRRQFVVADAFILDLEHLWQNCSQATD